MKNSRWFIGLTAVVLLLTSFSIWHPFGQRVDFNTQVKPILNKNCIACHGGVKKASNYSLLFAHEALAPAKSGKLAIVPGDANASELIRRIELPDADEDRMPLDHPHLSPADIQTLRHWIDEGAEWGNHWAYQPPTKPDVPTIGSLWDRIGLTHNPDHAWMRNEIDAFVLARRTAADIPSIAELHPMPETDRATLLRRVSLDITGLPPTETEQTDFLADKSPLAYEKAVDRLLASSAYGERWAGLWLDLARYADTKGYERDPGRKIWRYRDYLIRSFNVDKPYDQFLTEQLAGDLLPNRTDETLIATGFHRNTMTNDEGGTQDEEFRTAAVMDRVSTTWDVFQGTTFACVQCHSHPYDPFVHEDYYRYLAFFNNTRDEDVTTETPTLRFYKGADSIRLLALKTYLHRAISSAQSSEEEQFVRFMEPKYNSHTIEAIANASLLDAKFFGLQNGGVGRLRNVTWQSKNAKQPNRLLISVGCGVTGSIVQLRSGATTGPLLATITLPNTGSEWADTVLSVPLASVPTTLAKSDLYLTMLNPKNPKKWVMINWLAFRPALPDPAMDRQFMALLNTDPETTPILWEGTGDLARPTHVFERGNWTVKGAQVQPGTPKSLPPMATGLPKNRLGLARWMTQPNHPLTARVAVNRLWEQLFGLGIVETVEDFGTQGIQPTHRDLLDWLAVTFQTDDHWSLKKTLRRMVLSATYRQKSTTSPAQIVLDPTNKWLLRGPRVRLTAEQVRDQALSVSGLLSRRMYGPSVMPPQPDGVWQSPYNGDAWVADTGQNRYRRAVYTYWKRTAPYPSMTTFDSPSREFCQVRRIRTDTPLQALVTLNDPVYVEAARHLALFMAQRGTTPNAQLRAGFRRLIGHDPTPRQLTILVQLYGQAEAHYRQQPAEAQKLLAPQPVNIALAALTVSANTMLNLDQVITKE